MTDFHDLYNKYANDIYRFALFLCGNEPDAEDITAETFTRLLTGKKPVILASVKGYMLTIARNLYLESVRRGKRFTHFPPDYSDSNPDLENVINNKNELESVMAYLQTFHELDRSALLFRADGLAYKEIAEALDISLASAKVKVHRLRMKLAEWRAKNELK